MKIDLVTLGDVCDFIGGSQPPKNQFSSKKREGYVRLVQTRDYKTDNFLTYIPEKSTSKFCAKKDIMIGRYGPPIFQILRGLEGAYNVALMKAVPKSNIRNEFLYYFLRQQSLFEYIDALSPRTGGQTGVDVPMLKNYPIRLPDLKYQEKVEKILCSLDTKIEINNRINTELEQLAKTLYDYWFVQFDFPNEQGKPYKSSGGKMVYSPELKREIPEGWKAGTLDDLGTIIGGSTPSKSNTKNFCHGLGIPWITPRDLSLNKGNKFITRGEFDATDIGVRDASLTIMPKGTVLLSSRAPIGYLAISRTEVTTNQGFKSFVTNKGYSTEYVFYTVKNMIPAIEKNGVGSTFKEVSGSTLKTIKISLPCKTLLKEYNSKAEPIFKRQDILETENQQLASLRDWLLPMLMNGQITVKDAEEKVGELGVAAEPEGKYKR